MNLRAYLTYCYGICGVCRMPRYPMFARSSVSAHTRMICGEKCERPTIEKPG